MRHSLSPFLLALALSLPCTACEQLAELMKQEPTAEEIFASKLAQARAASMTGNYAQAIQLYQEVSAFKASDTQAIRELGRIYMTIGDSRQAILSFKQVLVYDPTDLDAQRALADLYYLNGNYDAASKQLRRLVNASAGEPDVGLARLLATSLIRSNNLDEARPLVERIEENAAGQADTIALSAELHVAEGDEDEGADLLDQALRVDPNSTYVHLARARYFIQKENAEAAASELAVAAAAKPTDPEIIYAYGQTLSMMERHQEAATLLTTAMQTRYADARFAALLAEVKVELGDYAGAIQLTENILAQSKGELNAMFIRAKAMELSRPESPGYSVGAYQQILAAAPAYLPALHRVWPLLVAQNDKSEAIVALEMLQNQEKTTPDEDLKLAELYIDTGLHLKRAQKIIEAAAKESPGDDVIVELRLKLKARMKEIPTRSSMGWGGSGVQVLKGGH